ncbi:hypothetical protein [Oscillatoria sp. FACHB-1406]|uniref:hypothetical protein n=1 Tax=Oscillatoria sp. FACHB-1406 TaxID=2692846 RepID=UPI0018EFCE99|nr:hypothetical protein [Oscillatoria sp. FACHB-1406]
MRSRAEVIVDNYLYIAGIAHAYERKLPIDEEVYCDFYIPKEKVYIEYWGYDQNPDYLARKQEKLRIYNQNNFNLIELSDEDIKNLDDCLPQKLRTFGIIVD